MDLVPDWAPNVHPLLVHLPIALLFTAVLLDLIALFVRKEAGLRVAAVIVYVLGALGALASFLTGRAAADSVAMPAGAQAVLTEHADWATWTVWFFGIYALVRLALLIFDKKARVAVWGPLLLIGAGGLFLVFETAEHGGQLVFEQGVGVQAVVRLDSLVRAQQADLDRTRARDSGPQIAENGAWRWTPDAHAATVLASSFRWLTGDTTRLAPMVIEDAARGPVLGLQASGEPALFVLDQPLASLQADATVNLDDFDGSLMLVHNVQDADNYLFLAVEDGTMKQGRVENGSVTLMDDKPFDGSGWLDLRAVGDKTHFRGYAGGTLVVHGHGPAGQAGPVGLRIDGTGTVQLARMDVQSLR